MRRKLDRLWANYQWPVIFGLGGLALILGYIGFAKYAIAMGETKSPMDLAYLTLQLLSMNSGAVPGMVSWELQIARFLLPAVFAYTALRALTLIFNEQAQMVRLRFLKDHIVICGLGRKGVLLLEQFRDQGEQVVALEQDEGNDWIEACRELGAIVLGGDSTDLDLLRAARVNQAKYLIAVLGDDGANAEVALRAEELSQQRKHGMLTCVIHIVDPQLYDLLRERELGADPQSHFRLELFNVYERGARLLLQSTLTRAKTLEEPDSPPRLLVIGLGQLGESLVVNAAKEWHYEHFRQKGRLYLAIIDRDAVQKTESLCIRFPQLAKVCQLAPIQIEIQSPEFQKGAFLKYENGAYPFDQVYVCLDDESLALHAGLVLLGQMPDRGTPILIRMIEDTGLASLLHDDRHQNSSFKNLHAFGLLNRTCTTDLLLGGTHEILARELHNQYLQDIAYQRKYALPAGVPWEELPEAIKERNRRQADRIRDTLDEAGYRIAPLRDWDAADLSFSDEEISLMARKEHERWCLDMERDNWRYGPERDEDKRVNPDLVMWEDLPPTEREKNYRYVRDLPRLLSRAGFQLERMPANGG